MTCLTVSAAALVTGCSQSVGESSETGEDPLAKGRDVRMALRLIQNADGRELWAEINGTLHPLRCNSMIGLSNLVRGLGFSAWDVPTENDVIMEGVAAQKYGYDFMFAQPLSCYSGKGGSLYVVNRNGQKDYYVDFNSEDDNTAVAHMVGCSGLLEAMGFDKSKATEISQSILDGFTQHGDANDLNCRNDNGVLLHPAVDNSGLDNFFATRAQGSASINYYLFNGTRGFQMTCASPSGIREIIQGSGVPAELIPVMMPVGETEPPVEEALVDSRGTSIDCDMSNARLLAIGKNGADTYWVEAPAGSKTFHRIGCRELAHAIGVDLTRAEHVTEEVATKLLRVSLSPADDFACASSNDPL